MTKEKVGRWIPHVMATVGMLVWIGVTMHFKLYPFTILIVALCVPATVYNIVHETRSNGSVRNPIPKGS